MPPNTGLFCFCTICRNSLPEHIRRIDKLSTFKVQTPTKTSSIPVCIFRLVTLCQRLRFILRFRAVYTYVYVAYVICKARRTAIANCPSGNLYVYSFVRTFVRLSESWSVSKRPNLIRTLPTCQNTQLFTWHLPLCSKSWLHLWRTSYLLWPNYISLQSLLLSPFVNFAVSGLTLIRQLPVPFLPPIIHSKLDYCNSLYYKLSKSQLARLEPVSSRSRILLFVQYCR